MQWTQNKNGIMVKCSVDTWDDVNLNSVGLEFDVLLDSRLKKKKIEARVFSLRRHT